VAFFNPNTLVKSPKNLQINIDKDRDSPKKFIESNTPTASTNNEKIHKASPFLKAFG